MCGGRRLRAIPGRHLPPFLQSRGRTRTAAAACRRPRLPYAPIGGDMSPSHRQFTHVVFLATLLVACTSTAPTATPSPTSAATEQPATPTRPAPTSSPLPSPSAS